MLIIIELQYKARDTWRLCNNFGVTDIFFSVPAASVGKRTYSIGATLIPQDYCPQSLILQHSMIDLLTAVAHKPVGAFAVDVNVSQP